MPVDYPPPVKNATGGHSGEESGSFCTALRHEPPRRPRRGNRVGAPSEKTENLNS
jgi:hypothetical protein